MPMTLSLRVSIRDVQCSAEHSAALSAGGAVFTWGSGTLGRLGHGDEKDVTRPTLVCGLQGTA